MDRFKVIRNASDCANAGLLSISEDTKIWLLKAADFYQKYVQGSVKLEDVWNAFSNFLELYQRDTGNKCGSSVKIGRLTFSTANGQYKGAVWDIRNIVEGANACIDSKEE